MPRCLWAALPRQKVLSLLSYTEKRESLHASPQAGHQPVPAAPTLHTERGLMWQAVCLRPERGVSHISHIISLISFRRLRSDVWSPGLGAGRYVS